MSFVANYTFASRSKKNDNSDDDDSYDDEQDDEEDENNIQFVIDTSKYDNITSIKLVEDDSKLSKPCTDEFYKTIHCATKLPLKQFVARNNFRSSNLSSKEKIDMETSANISLLPTQVKNLTKQTGLFSAKKNNVNSICESLKDFKIILSKFFLFIFLKSFNT